MLELIGTERISLERRLRGQSRGARGEGMLPDSVTRGQQRQRLGLLGGAQIWLQEEKLPRAGSPGATEVATGWGQHVGDVVALGRVGALRQFA